MQREKENIGYLIMGVMLGVLGNIWVYFLMKSVEIFYDVFPNAYLAGLIFTTIPLFAMIALLYRYIIK